MTTAIPEYVAVAPDEHGARFGISFEDYRNLAKIALSVPSDSMAIYPLDEGCGLDLWHGNRCLTIQINSKLGHLALLLSSDIDSAEPPLCILSSNNSADEWSRLKQMVRKAI